MKTLYDIFKQSPKDISKELKETHGFTSYTNLRDMDVDKLCKTLKVKDDKTITRFYTITRGGQTEIYMTYVISTDFGKIDVPIELGVKGKCNIKIYQIGNGSRNNILLKNKEEISFSMGNIAQYAGKNEYNGNDIFNYSDDKPIGEYLNELIDGINDYKKDYDHIELQYFNGEYKEASENYYNKAHLPLMTFTIQIYRNARKLYDRLLTNDELCAIYKYWGITPDEISLDVVKTLISEFPNKYKKPTLAEFNKTIEDATNNLKIDKSKKIWNEFYDKVMKEFHDKTEELKKEIYNKYGIEDKYLNLLHYDEKTEKANWIGEIPEKFKKEYR